MLYQVETKRLSEEELTALRLQFAISNIENENVAKKAVEDICHYIKGRTVFFHDSTAKNTKDNGTRAGKESCFGSVVLTIKYTEAYQKKIHKEVRAC